jgi:hypothetical protein
MATRVLSVTANASATTVKLRAGVTLTVPLAGVTYTSLASGASVSTPVAGIAYTYPVSDIAYILLASSAYLDTSGRFRYIAEIVNIFDGVEFTTSKTAGNEYIVVDDGTFSIDFSSLYSDSVSISDTIITVLIFIRNFTDTVAVSDILVSALTFVRNFTDTTTIADATAKLISPAYFETVTPSDAKAIFTAKDIADYANNTVLMSDGHVLLGSKEFLDTTTVADNQAKFISPSYFENVISSDSSSLSIIKVFADSFALNDLSDVAGPTISFADFTNNVVSTSDSSVVASSKVFLDSFSLSDSGTVISQDYCDITYFLTDYVGESRTF